MKIEHLVVSSLSILTSFLLHLCVVAISPHYLRCRRQEWVNHFSEWNVQVRINDHLRRRHVGGQLERTAAAATAAQVITVWNGSAIAKNAYYYYYHGRHVAHGTFLNGNLQFCLAAVFQSKRSMTGGVACIENRTRGQSVCCHDSVFRRLVWTYPYLKVSSFLW